MQDSVRIRQCCIRFYERALWKMDRYANMMSTMIRIMVTLFFYYLPLVVNLMIVTTSLVGYKCREKIKSFSIDLLIFCESHL